MSDQPCPFCNPRPAERIFYEDDLTRGLWDGFPVSPGHALLVPRRHVATWFDATAEEQAALMRALSAARDIAAERHRPDGYNVGINVGEAAGQTVFHLHIHLIPRYSGDVADARGGVRHVIPSKGNYLLAAGPGTEGAPSEPRRRALVSGGEDDPLLAHLFANIDESDSLDWRWLSSSRAGSGGSSHGCGTCSRGAARSGC
jgi:diadenosine tetraphosphate (Ap4A) HIT family hydrolase